MLINFYILSNLLILSWAVELEFGCKTHATILRQLETEGFRLEVHSLIEWVVDIESALKWENCSLVLKESIPNSFYINPDQLIEINRSGNSQLCTPDKVNTETPQHLSLEHTVYIYSPLQRSQNLMYANLKLPLHLRYHKPKVNGGYSFAELKLPILLVSCPFVHCDNLLKIRAPCSLCGSQICTWLKFPYKINKNSLTLSVPVGNINHLWFVTIITYALTYGGCIYILLTIIGMKLYYKS